LREILATVLGRLDIDTPHFVGYEVCYWPKRALEVWTDWGVLRAISPSTGLPCHECGGDYYGEVVYVNSLRTGELQIFLPCPECGTSRVDPDELRRWTVDVEQLVRRVFQPADVRLDFTQLVPDRLWRVGRSDWAGRAWSVLFGRMFHRRDAREILTKATIPSRSVVFVPDLVPKPDPTDDRRPLIISLTSATSWHQDAVRLDRQSIEDRLAEWIDARRPATKPAARKRASRTADIEALATEMREHLRAARRYALATLDQTGQPQLLPRPTQEQLARRVGRSQHTVSRCLKDQTATELRFLWDLAIDLDRVLHGTI